MSNTNQRLTMAAKHANCMNTPCVGPGCRVTDYHYNTCAPRVNMRPTKAEKRLERRINDFNSLNKASLKHEHHKPGSHNK